jgi:16S rRNA (guanine1207-N2)-methyltransferase
MTRSVPRADAPPGGIYGAPPPELVDDDVPARQYSPLEPGAASLEDLPEGSLARIVVLAPPGTLERRYVLASALRALAPGGRFLVLAPKNKGGARLAKELAGFGSAVKETSKRHFRICSGTRPQVLRGVNAAFEAGGLRFDEALGLWTQPGVFSWDRIDPGTALLLEHLPPLAGQGADFGCGLGVLARAVLASPRVERLALYDIDRRALEAAERNLRDDRASFHWTDLRADKVAAGLDFVVMNPPFHDGGIEDRNLGQAFIRRAAEALRPGGTCWLVANRHLPYEAVMKPLFRRVAPKAETGGYKIYEALK